MADKPTTSDEILRHLIEIHQEAADREDLPDWIREANANHARRLRRTLEQPEEEEE
jgi:hypothetical protein